MENTGPVQRLSHAYAGFARAASSLQSLFLLAVRLYWGWQFFQTGWGKLHHLDKVTQFFGTLGLPVPGATALFVACLETFGGILLALGFGSRLISLLLFCSMSVAYITSERAALLSIFSDPGKFYGADPFTFWFVALIVLLFGPGLFSLDYLISKYTLRHQAPSSLGAYKAPVLP